MAERAGAPAAKKAKYNMEARANTVRQQGNIKAWLEKVPLVHFNDNSGQERALRRNIFKEVLDEEDHEEGERGLQRGRQARGGRVGPRPRCYREVSKRWPWWVEAVRNLRNLLAI